MYFVTLQWETRPFYREQISKINLSLNCCVKDWENWQIMEEIWNLLLSKLTSGRDEKRRLGGGVRWQRRLNLKGGGCNTETVLVELDSKSTHGLHGTIGESKVHVYGPLAPRKRSYQEERIIWLNGIKQQTHNRLKCRISRKSLLNMLQKFCS